MTSAAALESIVSGPRAALAGAGAAPRTLQERQTSASLSASSYGELSLTSAASAQWRYLKHPRHRRRHPYRLGPSGGRRSSSRGSVASPRRAAPLCLARPGTPWLCGAITGRRSFASCCAPSLRRLSIPDGPALTNWPGCREPRRSRLSAGASSSCACSALPGHWQCLQQAPVLAASRLGLCESQAARHLDCETGGGGGPTAWTSLPLRIHSSLPTVSKHALSPSR